MTNGEIFIRALADATGVPVSKYRKLLAEIRPALGDQHKLDEHRPEAEAQRLLAALRLQREQIRRWLAEGYLMALADGWPPHPPRRLGRDRKKKSHTGGRKQRRKPHDRSGH